MITRLAESRRIRTCAMGGDAIVADGVAFDGVLYNYIFQDDVTLIGHYLRCVPLITDALSNQDTRLHGNVELTRSATRRQPGHFALRSYSAVWNGLFYIGGDADKEETVFYPEGYGIEIDEGEGVHLLAYFEYTGTIATVTWWGDGILYYVER